MTITIDRLASAMATRRATLAVGTAALLGVTQMHAASARKNRKGKHRKNRKSCEKQVEQQVAAACEPQTTECVALFSGACDASSDRPRCLADIAACCDELADCQFTEALLCLTSTPVD